MTNIGQAAGRQIRLQKRRGGSQKALQQQEVRQQRLQKSSTARKPRNEQRAGGNATVVNQGIPLIKIGQGFA
ncbi:hypothetical protein TNCT_318991 [Trichonephila clavata]|uniref:Uncharacterized protein n=1 Tax=Trichonephila clavata TaxID=2740835 RepID=A0A8X6HT36_TRICU|nr:hypothetical protein TNCT_318991 [Trichonephila clavata]